MTYRTFMLFLALLSLSCSSDVEEKAEDAKSIEERNTAWQKKSAEWVVKKQEIDQKNTLRNKGFIVATTPEMKVDMEKVKIVQEKAVKGDPEYQYSLAMCYKYGYGFKVDIEKSLYWFKKAADQGHKRAQKVHRFMLRKK